jgi:hypothetical protein
LADELATIGAAALAIRVRIGEFGTFTPEETTSTRALVDELDALADRRPESQRPKVRRLASGVNRGDYSEREGRGGEDLRGDLQIVVLAEINLPRIRVTATPGNYADYTPEQATAKAHELLAAAKQLEEASQ